MMSDLNSKEKSHETASKTTTNSSHRGNEADASTEAPRSAAQNLSEMLDQAREDVKTSIRELSRLNGGDVEGWILEARRLKQDIEESRANTEDLQTLATRQKELEHAKTDATHKVDFLNREIAFNGSLTTTLEQILALRNTIDAAQDALISMQIRKAANLIQEAERGLSELDRCQRTGLINLFQSKISDIRDNLCKAVVSNWHRLFVVDHSKYEIRIRERVEADQKTDILNTVYVLDRFDLFKGRLIQFKKDVEALIFLPRIGKGREGAKRTILITGPIIQTTEERPDNSIERLLADISGAFNYFSLILPSSVAAPLLQILAPSVANHLILGPLAGSVPPDLSGISFFAQNLSQVRTFAETMGKRKWPGGNALLQWVQDSPTVWLNHRANSTLSSVRQLLGRGIGKPRSVERIETQQVLVEDEAFQENSPQDDWNKSWSDDEDEDNHKGNESSAQKSQTADEDADAAAWGWDEDEASGEAKPAENKAGDEEDDNDEDEDEESDAWGWGDEDQQLASPSTKSSRTPAKKPSNSAKSPEATQGATKEVTLRETYHVTALPEQIMEIVVEAVDDAESLTSSNFEVYDIVRPAGDGLFALPGLILSMFRACAPNTYMQDVSGNMFLYNDSLYLCEQLRAFAAHKASRRGPDASSPTLVLDNELAALETFGKAAYGREMDAQRTIVRDLLDGAQGFAHCTTAPFATPCALAVESTLDRLRTLHTQWADVLAPSALQQAIGSLLGTATAAIVVAVEELDDISEPESRRLVAFCQQFEELNVLFLPPEERAMPADGESDEERDLRAARSAVAASVYAPGLLKFQWLAQILEGALADIRFWWTEGDLSAVFEADEVVDLIRALFADSEHRRRAIAEVRGRYGS